MKRGKLHYYHLVDGEWMRMTAKIAPLALTNLCLPEGWLCVLVCHTSIGSPVKDNQKVRDGSDNDSGLRISSQGFG